MKKQDIEHLSNDFTEAMDKLLDVEYWREGDLRRLLGFASLSDCRHGILRAMEACVDAGIDALAHFGALDGGFILTRYGCYLLVAFSPLSGNVIEFARVYFSLSERDVDSLQRRMDCQYRIGWRRQLAATEAHLSSNLSERGISADGFGRIRSKGDAALFGRSTPLLKKHFGISANRALADFLPSVTIAAKNLAMELTNYTTEHDNLTEEEPITSEHIQNNKDLRQMLAKRGITPEDLPPEEDIRKVTRRINAEEKRIAKESGILPRLFLK